MANVDFITELKDAELLYQAAIDRGLNIVDSRRRVENILWTYREDIVAILTDIDASVKEYKDKVAELEAMLDAAAKVAPKAEAEPAKKAKA